MTYKTLSGTSKLVVDDAEESQSKDIKQAQDIARQLKG